MIQQIINGEQKTTLTSENDETQLELTARQIIDTLFTEKKQYEESNSTQRNDINDIYSAYMGRMDEVKAVPYKSKETIPKLRSEVSYITPFIFSGNPEIEVEGVGEEDKAIAQLLEKIVNFRLNTIPQAYEKIEAWVKQAVTFGTSLIKVCWKFETQKNPDGTESPIKDEPELEVPNILDCFYNPIIPETENQISLIFRSVLNADDVKNNPIYDYTDELGALNRTKIEGKGSKSINQYDSSKQMGSDKLDLTKAAEGTVELYERITRDRIQTVYEGGEKLVLRDTENPYGINAVKFIYEPNCIPNRFDGMGVGQNTLGLGKLFFKMMNQTLDNVALTNNPMFLFKKGANIDARQLVAKPGGGIAVDTEGGNLQESIQPVLFPDIKQGAINILDKIDDEHKRASGANDLLQGSASNKTLGQDELATTFSSNRFELINRRFKQALADVADMIIRMELKNLQSPDAAVMRIFPEEMRMEIYQVLISGASETEYNIKIKGDTTVARNKDIQIKQLTDAYNLFGGILPANNQMEWARKILQLRGIDEIDKLVPDPQQYAEMQRQLMTQQAGPISQQGIGGEPTSQGIQKQTYGQ